MTSPSSRSNITTPGSYMYTSSSSLLRNSAGVDKVLPRAVPPPTLPKYTTTTSSFRLASLDRLAHRQRQFDQQGVPVVTPPTSVLPPQQNGDAMAQSPAVSLDAVQFAVTHSLVALHPRRKENASKE